MQTLTTILAAVEPTESSGMETVTAILSIVIYCALALIAMHVVLEVLTNVGWWNFIMVAGLLAFLPPTLVARALPGPTPASR